MAARGAKPKPGHLHLIDGTRNTTRHGSEAELRSKVEAAVESFGRLKVPKGLEGRALACWKRMIIPAKWLDASKQEAARVYCELIAEWEEAPRRFPASRLGQMRAFSAELGLTDERNRGKTEKKEKDEFFDD